MSSKRHKKKHQASSSHARDAAAHVSKPLSETFSEFAAQSPPDELPHDEISVAPPREVVADPVPTFSDPSSTAAIGAQLQMAREAQGLSLEDAGHKLRLPARVLRKLESDDLTGIDYPIYLRGYLRSYSKLLGVALPSMQTTIEHAAVATPALTPTGGTSHGRYLLQRYAAVATYLVVTALIVVPLLVLGLDGGIHRETARVAPLESASSTSVASMVTATAPKKSSEEPLMASMAPFAALQKDLDHGKSHAETVPADAAPAAEAASPVDALEAHHIDIQLQAPSWVEITDAVGTRLEYGLLSAGDYRYHSKSVLDIRLGNSADATVDVDGVAVDLQPYRRANVAHFRLDPKTGKPPEATNG